MHVGALRRLATQHGAMTLNAGSGRARSVREVLAEFERACGRKVGTRVLPRRAGDVAAVAADTARAAHALDALATRDLDTICADAWRWQKNGGRY